MAKGKPKTNQLKVFPLIEADLGGYTVTEDKLKRIESGIADMWAEKVGWAAFGCFISAFLGVWGCQENTLAWKINFGLAVSSFVLSAGMFVVAWRATSKQTDVLAEIRAQKNPPIPTDPTAPAAEEAAGSNGHVPQPNGEKR